MITAVAGILAGYRPLTGLCGTQTHIQIEVVIPPLRIRSYRPHGFIGHGRTFRFRRFLSALRSLAQRINYANKGVLAIGSGESAYVGAGSF
jgi:hypothetical protein